MRIMHERQQHSPTSVARSPEEWPIPSFRSYFVDRIKAEMIYMRENGLRSGNNQTNPFALPLHLTAADEAELEFHVRMDSDGSEFGRTVRTQIVTDGIRSLGSIFGHRIIWDAAMFMLDVEGADPP